MCPEPCTRSGIETVFSQGPLDEVTNGWNVCRTECSDEKETKMRARGRDVFGSSIQEPGGNISSGAPRDLL